MSVTHEVTIWCDGDYGGCGNWQQGTDGITQLRAQLNNAGWSVRGRGRADYCPECLAEMQGRP